MKYNSDTIAQIMKRLNNSYFLPAIQREYVWHQDQIIALFDSLMRGYPISTFLFWELDPENHSKWEIYTFIDSFHQAGTHNEIAKVDRLQQLTLILDGQQRLTSLLIGLKGTYTMKRKYAKGDKPDAWITQKLYLDLFHDPDKGDATEEDLHYDFRFKDLMPQPVCDDEHYWFEVGRILDLKTGKSFNDFLEELEDNLPDTVQKGQVKIFHKNLQKLYNVIWEQQCIAYYTEHDQDFDRVLTIFVRANQGGTVLSKSDLLLSMMTAKWEDRNAREVIYDFVEHLNNDFGRKNNFSKDFIMKTSLVLSDLPVAYKVENFTSQNLGTIRYRWQGIQEAIQSVIRLINNFGIDRENLTSANALIPIIYYAHKYPERKFGSNDPFDVHNTSRIRTWLLLALLNNTFSGQSDRALNDTRNVLKHAGSSPDFPASAINRELGKANRRVSFDPDAMEAVLELTNNKPLAFLALSLFEEDHWRVPYLHQAHIFAQDQFKQQQMKKIGLTSEQEKKWKGQANRLGNLFLLSPEEASEKSEQPLDIWLSGRSSQFKKQHLIPDDSSLFSPGCFPEFIQARNELISQRIESLFQSLQ